MPAAYAGCRADPAGKNIPRTAGQFKILGVLGRLYVLMENEGGLVLVDQHAAHERILFEELRRRLEANEVISQKLLLPLTLQLPPKDADWLRQHLHCCRKWASGWRNSARGRSSSTRCRRFCRWTNRWRWCARSSTRCNPAGAGASRMRLGEDMIAKTVCRHAVKANDHLRERELVRLLEDLLACELPYCCPHGRPTMIQMSYGELERKFGRRA